MFEVQRGDDLSALENLLTRDSGKVGYLGKLVEDSDDQEGDGSSPLDGANGVADLANGVEEVSVTNVAPTGLERAE